MATRRSPSWPAAKSDTPSEVLMSGFIHRGRSTLLARLTFRSRISTNDSSGSSRSQLPTLGRRTSPLARNGPRSGGFTTSRLPRGSSGGGEKSETITAKGAGPAGGEGRAGGGDRGAVGKKAQNLSEEGLSRPP